MLKKIFSPLAPAAVVAPPTAMTPNTATKAATEHLLKELQKLTPESTKDNGYKVEPVNDNIYKWKVSFFGFDDSTQISQDLKLYEATTGRNNVLMEIIFPPSYPKEPPFMRVVYPRFHQWTGHITIGGSVCIQELTRSGWRSEFELSTFIIMIRNLLLEGMALIDMDNANAEYTEAEARDAFDRVARQHGWIP